MLDVPGFFPICSDVTDDGSIVVGSNGDGSVFRWTYEGGTEIIGSGQAHETFWAKIAGDGSAIVSDQADSLGVSQAARYTEGDGWQLLGGGANIDGSISSGWGISQDGSVVTGFMWTEQARAEGFSWTQGGGMVGLGATRREHPAAATT